MAVLLQVPRRVCRELLGARRTCSAALRVAAGKALEPKLLRSEDIFARHICSGLRSCAQQCHLTWKLATHSTKHGQHSKSMVAAPYRETLSMANRHDEL